jgi:beta-lactam-binding protein with PASTA domain
MWITRYALLMMIGLLCPIAGLAQDLVTVPSLVGLTETQARTRLQESGVVGSVTVEIVEWRRCERTDVVPGTVCAQSPSGGRRQFGNMEVWLGVPRGERTGRMPSLTRLTEAQARRRLSESGFVGQVTVKKTTPEIRCESGGTEETGTICSQEPASGAMAPFGTAVTVVIRGERSLEDDVDYPPAVVGMKRHEAIAKLAQHNYRWVQLRFIDTDAKCAPGVVCRTNAPPERLYPRRSTVRVELSVGGVQAAPKERFGCVRMINVTGMSPEDAITRLDLIGYRGIIVVGESELIQKCAASQPNPGAGLVCTQTYPAGEELCSGAKLGLFVAP